MANRLAHETSPYLLQHAENPVDWYPWGPEALERARREDKPILLSIGYAACHWCHVMAHESFENPQIAARMNELFVNIKVDREERPDLDSIYMQAVQAMTGHGGWPMTVFLTPEGVPYYGGTYYPPTDRHGMPGFPRVLEALSAAYREQPGAIASTGAQIRELFDAAGRSTGERRSVDEGVLRRASSALAARFDRAHAGFGGAPKFPPSMALEFLLTRWARTGENPPLEMALQTFLAMARGGIYDQVGGGLHRYSVDERWQVPHFEKMLYDNALFLRLGVHLWQATGDDEVRRACRETAGWVLREMTSPEGGFFSSLDADSEGHEGLFYVWTADELDELLGGDAAVAKAAWGVTPGGNFEGRNILHRPQPLSDVARHSGVSEGAVTALLERARAQLFLARSNRVWPTRDDKVIASWNGLMLRALAEYARILDDDAARRAAVASGEFLLAHLVRDGRVLRSWRQGKVLEVGFLDDQAAVGLALLELYTLTADGRWMHAARAIAARTIEGFYDAHLERFFDTPTDHEALVTRPRDVGDNALPAGTSLVAELLLRLGTLDARDEWTALGEHVLADVGEGLAQHPQAFGHLATVADMPTHGAVEVVIVGANGHGTRRELERTVAGVFLPSSIVLVLTDQQADETALGRGRRAIAGNPMAYVCRGYVCDAPSGDPKVLARQLRQALRPLGAELA